MVLATRPLLDTGGRWRDIKYGAETNRQKRKEGERMIFFSGKGLTSADWERG